MKMPQTKTEQNRSAHLVRACGVEMHMEITQRNFFCDHLRQKWRAPETLIYPGPLYSITVRTPQCGHVCTHCLGKNCDFAVHLEDGDTVVATFPDSPRFKSTAKVFFW